MNDNIELTEQDEQDIAKLLADPPKPNPILKVWREVFSHIPTERAKRVTPQWSTRILGSYAGLTFADMQALQDRYFDKLAALMQIVEDEIALDDECLKVADIEEDREHNAGHYLTIMIEWQKLFMRWELDWRAGNPDAAIELAAISEAHASLFGNDMRPGVVQYLDSINLRFTDADQAELQRQLHELVENYEEDK